jgi:hypothetical protein
MGLRLDGVSVGHDSFRCMKSPLLQFEIHAAIRQLFLLLGLREL